MAPSIRTMDANIRGLEAGERAYTGVTKAKSKDQYSEFTFNGRDYHVSFTGHEQYHITDETAGRKHYWFKIGVSELEDLPKRDWPADTKKDHALSALPLEVLKLVQALFGETLPHPTVLKLAIEKREAAKKIASDWVSEGVYDDFEEAFAAAMED
jgi:hypothetical protein